MSKLYNLYKMLDKKSFSQKICEIAPYFSTINPVFKELRPNYAEVFMPNVQAVHNHLGTVHAIAMCNLAEIAAGIMTDVSIPENYRWIPVGMKANYLEKAQTDLIGIADASEIEWEIEGFKDVPVSILDENNTLVCSVLITVKISAP